MKIDYPALDDRGFLQKYLSMLNLLLPVEQHLLPSEIELIIEFALLPDDKFAYQRFGSLAKNKVIAAVAERNWKLTKLNINNKLYGLLDKKFLKRDTDKVIYMPKHLLIALDKFRKDKTFEVKLTFKSNDSK